MVDAQPDAAARCVAAVPKTINIQIDRFLLPLEVTKHAVALIDYLKMMFMRISKDISNKI